MKNWFNRNYRTLIISAFLIPIIIVAFVSISHVSVWYDISNPNNWAAYLSVGIEIAALSALAAISANMGRKVYFPFFIVTLVQFIGNIFFAYQFIDINSKLFKDWVDLVTPLLSLMGVDEGDMIGHKRFLALFSGGLLPMISLSFLHMLVKFSENKTTLTNEDKYLEEEKKKMEEEFMEKRKYDTVDSKDVISEVSKVRLSEDDLKKLEEILLNPPAPNENLKSATTDYNNFVNNKVNIDNEINNDEVVVNELYQASEDESINKESENLLDEELIEIIELQTSVQSENIETNNQEIQKVEEVQEVENTIVFDEPTQQNDEIPTTPQPTQAQQIINSYNELEEKKNS
jgi:hypothetical protein